MQEGKLLRKSSGTPTEQYRSRANESPGCRANVNGSTIASPRLIEQMGPLLVHLQDELAEGGVCPGEPGAGELLRVVLVEGFVDEAGACVRPLEGREAEANLAIICARQRPLDDAQRPDHVEAGVRSARTFRRFALEVIRVVIRQHEATRVLVNG